MKQQIENIIKKNLPEKKEEKQDFKNVVEMAEYEQMKEYFDGFNDCLDNIDTSLLADEVLKVVVVGEIMRFMEKIQERANKIPPNLLLNEVVNYAYDRKKELLSSLSLNKENEN